MGCLSDLVWEMDAPGNGLLTVSYLRQIIIFFRILFIFRGGDSWRVKMDSELVFFDNTFKQEVM